MIRAVARKIAMGPDLAEAFAWPLALARRVKDQRPRERGRKVSSLHAPEVACIGQGKAPKPDEFGVKGSVATPLRRGRGGPFGAPVQALPGPPDDGPTRARVIPAIEATVGAELARIVTDAGSQGHPAPNEKRFRVLRGGPEARAPGRPQARLPAPCGRRAGDRASQGRAPQGPHLSRPQRRGRDQRRAGGRGL